MVTADNLTKIRIHRSVELTLNASQCGALDQGLQAAAGSVSSMGEAFSHKDISRTSGTMNHNDIVGCDLSQNPIDGFW